MSIFEGIRRITPGSNKPYKKTAKDAIITTTISIFITFILLYLWSYYDGITEGILTTLLQTAVIAFILQFVYEYLGVNAMMYESSMRYMKGSTLNKFTSTRWARCIVIFNELTHNITQYVTDTTSTAELLHQINENMTVLELLITENSKVQKLLKDFPNQPDMMLGSEYELLMAACQKNRELLHCLTKLPDKLTDDLIKSLMLTGFANCKNM